MSAHVIYMTAKDAQQARAIGRALVQERLVACVNIVESITSLYWWEGDVQEDREAVMIAKTEASLVGTVIERVKALHDYECPCVVSWPIEAGNDDYLQWVASETRPQ